MAVHVHSPLGYYTGVTDFRNATDEGGGDIETRNIKFPFRAHAAITQGQALMTVAPTEPVPLSVTPMTTAVSTSDPWAFAGIAAASADAGDVVDVVVWGYTRALLEAADTPAA